MPMSPNHENFWHFVGINQTVTVCYVLRKQSPYSIRYSLKIVYRY